MSVDHQFSALSRQYLVLITYIAAHVNALTQQAADVVGILVSATSAGETHEIGRERAQSRERHGLDFRNAQRSAEELQIIDVHFDTASLAINPRRSTQIELSRIQLRSGADGRVVEMIQNSVKDQDDSSLAKGNSDMVPRPRSNERVRHKRHGIVVERNL